MMESTDMNKPGMPEPAENAKVPEEMSTLAGSVELSIEQLDEATGGNAPVENTSPLESRSHTAVDGKTGESSVNPDNMGLGVKISKNELPYLLKTIFRIKGDADNR